MSSEINACESQAISSLKYASGQWEAAETHVIMEAPVSLTVNGEDWLTLLCTPTHIEALAVGFLYNEGFLQQSSQIASVRACPSGDNVDVWLNHPVEKPSSWRRTSGCTGGVTHETESDQRRVTAPPEDSFRMAPAQITGLIAGLIEAQHLYRRTGGVHTSALSDGEKICLAAEDIGRHNSLDKLAGRCLLEGQSLRHPVVVTTGRISSEMLQKSARLGARVVISRTSPSALSVRSAEQLGLTLVGYARRGSFTVYTHFYRLDPGIRNERVSQS